MLRATRRSLPRARKQRVCGSSPCMAARAASSIKAVPTGRRCAPSKKRVDPRRRQWRYRKFRRCRCGACGIRRRRGDGRARRARAAVVSRSACALSRKRRTRNRRRARRAACSRERALRRNAWRIMASLSACATRENISAGRSMRPRLRSGAPAHLLKEHGVACSPRPIRHSCCAVWRKLSMRSGCCVGELLSLRA